MRGAVRNIVAGLIALAVLAQAALTIATLNQQIGVYGYTVGLDGVTVGSITSRFPAENAGLRPGDRFVYKRLTFLARVNSAFARAVPSGTVLTFPFVRNGVERSITMRAKDYAPNSSAAMRLFCMVASLAFAGIGLALVLLRPNCMTWGFLLWGTFAVGGTDYWQSVLAERSIESYALCAGLNAVISGVSSMGLLMFVSRFPNAVPQPSLRPLAIAAVPYGATVCVMVFAQLWYATQVSTPPPAWLLDTVAYGIPAVNLAVTMFALLSTLLVRRGAAAQRITPVLIAVASYAIFNALLALQEFLYTEPTLSSALAFCSDASLFAIAIAVAYGVVKHRVIDVSFVVGRTVVFTLLCAAVVCVLIILHRIAVDRLPNDALRVFLEIAGATAIGMAIPRIHAAIGTLLDRTMFVARHRAEKHLMHVAEAIECADEPQKIAGMLVQQPVQSLSLASAAYFERRADGEFVRVAGVGWPSSCSTTLEHNHLLPLYLTSSPQPLHLEDDEVDTAEFPTGSRVPVFALGVYARKRLQGIALYGAPSDGTALDNDQRRLLERLTKAASFAHDAIALAERAIEANRERDLAQTALVRTLQGHIDELESLNDARARFIPNEFLRLLGKESIDEIRLGDHVEREMTVLFADIRGFSAISERLAPSESFEFINAYLHRVGPLVREHGGFIDKYIGDSIMALFPGDPRDALDAALAVQREVRIYGNMLESQGKPRVEVGVGLHYGTLMLGTIGERARMETTVISDAVNLASRMEGVTKLYGASIVLSDATVAALPAGHDYLLRPLGRIVVKGKQEALALYEAYGAERPEVVAHKHRSHERFVVALKHFEAGDWEMARRGFTEVAGDNLADAAARHFIHRCNALLETASTIEWDGIERLQTK